MGYLNLGSSIKYGPHGKKRKTKAFTTKSKKQKYTELLLQQQKVFNRVVREISQTENKEEPFIWNIFNFSNCYAVDNMSGFFTSNWSEIEIFPENQKVLIWFFE